MKHSFPEKRSVLCSTHCDELTDKNISDLIEACDENGVNIYSGTRSKMRDREYPYYRWATRTSEVTQSRSKPLEEPESTIIVPFDVFLQYARGGGISSSISTQRVKNKIKFLY